MSLVGKTVEEQMWNFFMARVGNAHGVAALMGHWYAESGLRPNNLQNSYEKKLGYTDESYTKAVDNGSYTNFVRDSAGYGLAQWTYWSRKQNLLSFAREKGCSIGDTEMQFEFGYQELSTSYKGVLTAMKSAKSVREASDVLLTQYERPANQGEAVKVKRAGYGEVFYKKYAGAGNKPQNGGKSMSMVKGNEYAKGIPVQLSRNFKSTEFDCHGRGCCSVTPVAPQLVAVLQDVRDHFGLPVNLNCGYRCAKHNAEVSGASKTSKHLYGQAADIAIKGVHPMRIARYIETVPGFAGRIGCYTWSDAGSGFVHIDVRGTNSRAVYVSGNTKYDTVSGFSVPIRRGKRGRIVTVVQRRLAAAGLYKGTVDGSCGAGTEAAILAWNRQHGRPDDKVWGPACWQEAFPV